MRSRVAQLAVVAMFILTTLFAVASSSAQKIDPARGVDPRVDYAALERFGPWDDRNYALTTKDIALLAKDEESIQAAIPAFFRVELRRQIKDLPTSGPARYPHSALPKFLVRYSGYLIDGKVYPRAVLRDGKYRILLENGVTEEDYYQRVLTTNVRVTTPNGGAE